MSSRLYSLADLSVIIDTPYSTLARHAESGLLPSIKKGERVYVADSVLYEIFFHGWTVWRRKRKAELKEIKKIDAALADLMKTP